MEHRLAATKLVSAEAVQPPIVTAGRRKPAWKRQLAPAALILSDALFALLMWGVADALQNLWGKGPATSLTVAALVPVVIVWVGLRALFGLYPGYGLGAVELLRRHTYSVLATLAILAIFALGFKVGDMLSRLLLGLLFVGLMLVTPFVRVLVRRVLKRAGLWGRPVVILSDEEDSPDTARLLTEEWELGYDPVAVFEYRSEITAMPTAVPPRGVGHGRDLTEAVLLAREQGADTAIFAMPRARREELSELVSVASISFRHVLVMPNLSGIANSAAVARDLAGRFAVEIRYNLLDPWALWAKRVMDFCATVVGGVFVLPFILLLALLVYLESGGPVFYRDQRMGLNGQLFSCIKFRTMVSDAEDRLERILEENPGLKEEYARYHKLRHDPRVTRVGSFLRKSSLDELPQIWNVLRGEMSLVGPRPYLPRESKVIGLAQSDILRVLPGITGPWQVAGRSYASFDDRVRMDAVYVRDWSAWLDIILLARTLKTVLLGRGAY